MLLEQKRDVLQLQRWNDRIMRSMNVGGPNETS